MCIHIHVGILTPGSRFCDQDIDNRIVRENIMRLIKNLWRT